MAPYEAAAFWDSFDTAHNRLAVDTRQWAEIGPERVGGASTLTDDL